MRSKFLRNLLSLALCIIGIGIACAPPAYAEVPEVPTIAEGDFDPYIYDCKTFNGHNTVSLRWEIRTPKDIAFHTYSQTAIDTTKNEVDKSRMIAWNEFSSKYTAKTFDLKRDGYTIISKLDVTSFVDMNVADGSHSYEVVAHYKNGRTVTSPATTVKVERDLAVTSYVLEEVYNYPIVNEEDYNKLSDKENSFKAFGTVTGDDSDIHRPGFLYRYGTLAYSSPGDGVRQAVFRNGKWYIAMITNRKKPDGDETIKYGVWDAYTQEERGQILEIDADGINNNPLKKYADLRLLSNQSLAMTDDTDKNYFYFRGYNGDPDTKTSDKIKLNAGERYFETITDLGGLLGDKTVKHWTEPIGLKAKAEQYKESKEGQYYRTHYMAARGKVADGTAKLCFAQNYSKHAYIIDIDQSGKPTSNYIDLKAPDQVTTKVNGEDRVTDIGVGTENYILPIEGQPDKYIHIIRSNGIFLVDVTDKENPKYTLISSDNSEIRSASGLTFTLENTVDGSTDLFFIHSTSVYSNNSGHFRIDMPQRKWVEDTEARTGKYEGDISTADFTNMVPVASKLQDEIPGFDAGNANGMWFGTQDGTEHGIAVKYIYQYVPGVRFAKYKFYPIQAFPPARPEIDVEIRHDDPAKDGTPAEANDITHFDISYSWKRPSNFDKEGVQTNFEIKGYNVHLLDPNNQVISGTEKYVDVVVGEDENTVYGPFYYNQQATVASGNKNDFSSYTAENAEAAGIHNVHEGLYTVVVTPEYRSTTDQTHLYPGEGGRAQDEADYTPGIYNIRAKLFQAKGNTNLYRVDIDFNRAPRIDSEAEANTVADVGEKDYSYYDGDADAKKHLIAEPASRFKIEVSKDGGTTWSDIDNLRIIYNGLIQYNASNTDEQALFNEIDANIIEHGGTVCSGSHNGYIKNDYDFGGNFATPTGRQKAKLRTSQADNNGDKMYVQEAIAKLYGGAKVDQANLNAEKANGAFRAVAYHMVDGSKEDVANIRNWKYRATALYADNQPYSSIKRTASVETTLGDPTTTGISDATVDATEGAVSIWPVPAESEVHIAATEAIKTVSIYDVSGSCVATYDGNGDTTMTINVDNIAAGVYLVKVNASSAQRLIKR